MDSFFARLDTVLPEDNRDNDLSPGATSSSDSASQTASQGPVAVGSVLRRRHSDDRDDDEIGDDSSEEVAHKRLKAYTRSVAAREGVSAASVEFFSTVSLHFVPRPQGVLLMRYQLPQVYREVEMYVKLTAYLNRLQEAQNSMSYIMSDDFRVRFMFNTHIQ